MLSLILLLTASPAVRTAAEKETTTPDCAQSGLEPSRWQSS